MKKRLNSLSKTDTQILNAVPWPSAILDENGNLITVNREWNNGDHCPCWIDPEDDDINLFHHCQKLVAAGNDFALRMIMNLRDISDGSKKSAEFTVSVDENKEYWYKVSISHIDGNIGRVLLIIKDETSNMQALISLRDSEEKYSHHFKHSVSGVILGDSTGAILDANPAACSILGYSRAELIEGGRTLIVDEKHPAHVEMLKSREENAFYEGEKEYIHKDGSAVPVEITSVVYRNGEGCLNVINTFRDKTIEKNTQYSLKEERRFSQTALNSIPGIFLVINREGVLERWNDSLNHELGYSAGEIQSMNCISLFDSSDRPWVQSVIDKIFETGSGNFVARITTKNDEIRFYHFHFNKFANHEKEYLVATAVDKTDYMKAENEREKNYELMSQLFENSPLAMVMIGTNGLVQRVNDSFISLFGYAESELIGEDVNTLITSGENLAEAKKVNNQAFKGDADTQETTRITKKGKKIPVLVNTVPIIYDGEVIAVYGIYVDLREQKELEINLQQSVEEKDILLQEVHHRVKNNLAIIAGLIDLQIIDENQPKVVSRLREVHRRVYSIAKIHETLYQQEDVVLIDFGEYLQTVIHSLYVSEDPGKFSFDINSDSTVKLNLNQAVPLSLAINELLNIKSSLKQRDTVNIRIDLIHEKDTVEVQIFGLNNVLANSGEDEKTSFEFLLLDTFLNQIDAKAGYKENSEQCIEIRFQKNDSIKGSSNGFIYK